MAFRWNRRPSQAWAVERLFDSYANGILAAWSVLATEIETYGKNNAPWTDRTGNARQTLAAFAHRPNERLIVLIFKQQMHYGKWLELAHGGRYAIVMQSLEVHYNDAMQAVKGVVR